MGDPYRERPRYLLCPRCAEVLDRAFEGVSSCLRCEGMWITPGTLDAAFGNPRWPNGQNLWWRNTVPCPECAFDGRETIMAARMANDVIVDQCSEHGLWLDRGELGRLMGGESDELGALRARLAVVAPDLDQLVARRGQWRADVEARRKATQDYRAALEDEHRQRRAVADAERARRTSEQPPPAPPALARSPAPVATKPPRRDELADERARAGAEVARLVGQLAVLQDHLHRLEADLAGTKHRAFGVERELDAARARLRKLDSQLDSL